MKFFYSCSFFIFCLFTSTYAQNYSLTCVQDTSLGCGVNCVDIAVTFPDIRTSSSDYSINNITNTILCNVPVAPDLPGTSTSLIVDDIYSNIIDLPFSFTYYGAAYNSLIVSTNGYISFDVSNTGQASHYENLGDLPTTSYDRAIIMSPYHDLDPRPSISPAFSQIKYDVVGVAPYRKFVVTFYKNSLYSCNSQFNNVSQIVLHENTGIVETIIYEKEICFSSQNGRAMIGMQNWNRDKGIMAPGRRESDAPWGGPGFMEGWRFVPSSGAPLFEKIELFDQANTLIATGDTTRISNAEFRNTFTNVCPPTDGRTRYTVIVTYKNINNPANKTVISHTIFVTRNAFPATIKSTATNCGTSTGSITATPIGGTYPFSYSLNGGAPQTDSIYNNLAAGAYSLVITDATGCTKTLTISVGIISNLTATFTRVNASCPGVNDGQVTITPTAGTAPYSYSVNGGTPQASNVFFNLSPGPNNFIFTDVNGCTGNISVNIGPGSNISGTASSTSTTCAASSNGSITANGSLGQAPYLYSINNGPYQASNIFTGLGAGSYAIKIQDNRGCIFTINRTVFAGAGLQSNATVTNIPCGSTTGSITVNPINGSGPYLYSINSGPTQLSNIFSGLIAGNYIITVQDAGGCVVSIARTVSFSAGLAATASSMAPSCAGASNGSITVTPTNGTAPYLYALDGGTPQPSNIFINVSAGAHVVSFTDANSCSGTVNVNVANGPAITATANATPTSCPQRNDGTLTVIPSQAGTYNYVLMPGNVNQVSPLFNNLAAGSYTISFTNSIGCSGAVSGSVTVPPGAALTSTITQNNPPCATINDGSVTITPTAGTAPYSYSISPGGPPQASNTFTSLAAGNYTYSFTDAGGCIGTGSFVITQNPAITTTLTVTMPKCFSGGDGSVSLFPSGGVAGYTYALLPSTSFQTSNTFTSLAAGSYNFRIRDNVGCTKDTLVTISEPTAVGASAINSLPATCFGNDGTITVSGNGGTPGYTYSINNGVTYQSNNVFVAPNFGAFNAIKVRDTNGCEATTSTTVALNDTMRLTLPASSTVCVESSIVLQPQTNTATSVFTWTTVPTAAVTTLDNTTIKNPTASPTDTTVYRLTAAWGVCSRTAETIINVLAKPVAYAGADTTICASDSATLRGSATNLSGTVNYSWSPNYYLNRIDSSVVISKPTPSSATTYTLTVRDNYGCNFAVTDDVKVTVRPIVVAFAGNDTTAILGMPHQMQGSGGSSYAWSPSAPLSNASISNPVAILQQDTRFALTVTDVIGCLGYDTVLVKVYDGPTYYLPNAFTPNGDGRNDIFRATPVGIVSTTFFRIYNRYGNLIFETNENLKGWDGSFKGLRQEQGAYIWIIKGTDRDGKVHDQKGTVLLLR